MENLRLKAGSEEIDYLQLKSLLHEYARPRDKIRQLSPIFTENNRP